MASSSSALALYCCIILVCVCSLQSSVVLASKPESIHLSYYVQEIREGPNRTVFVAAGTSQGNFAGIGWGSYLVFDHALREGPTADSKLLGRITGSAVISSIGGLATGGLKLNAAEHIFNEASDFPGSSITLSGTFAYPPQGWELIIPGGTGYFRGYSGYALGSNIDTKPVPNLYVWKWDIYLSKCKCKSSSKQVCPNPL